MVPARAAALKAGVDAAVIEAIRRGEEPSFERGDERLAYDVVVELQRTKRLSDETFERARSAWGNELLIEAVSAIGFYTTAAMMINAFDAPVPGGLRPLP
jgi:4-carboxymuconolactone decarboxylase